MINHLMLLTAAAPEGTRQEAAGEIHGREEREETRATTSETCNTARAGGQPSSSRCRGSRQRGLSASRGEAGRRRARCVGAGGRAPRVLGVRDGLLRPQGAPL